MNDIEIQISEQKFKKMEPADRDWTILMTFQAQTEECDKRFCTVEGEINKIKSRKWFHAGASAIGGFIGGVTAVVGKALFLK
jgi:hypothetical protein